MRVCGDTRPIIGDLVATGASAPDVDAPVPLDEARTHAGPDVSPRGNLYTSLLYRAAPADVRVAARQAIVVGGAPRYILGMGCEVPIGTPIENVMAMVEASKAAAASTLDLPLRRCEDVSGPPRHAARRVAAGGGSGRFVAWAASSR